MNAKLSPIGILAREDRLALQPGELTYWPSGHVGGMEDRANAAIREARAILSETEDGLSIHEHTFGRTYPVSLATVAPEFRDLAESLRAFIDAPIPE